MFNRLLVLLCLNSCLSVGAQQSTIPSTEKLIDQLTLEEKERIVVGSEMEIPWSEAKMLGVGMTKDDVPGAAGTSLPNERLNIPKVVFADGPAGVRISPERAEEPGKTYYATAFPVATMLASSFNVELMEEVGHAFGHEAKEYGVDVLLAPALNIHRNPLGGRNFEYYSEDPLLSGKMAAAFSNGVQAEGVGVCIKHFVANNHETNRQTVDVIVSERALREIYLKGFEIAVKESNPWSAMSAFNKINGEYASESKELLRTILREEWGFDGFVMTDWFGGEDVPKQLIAGNDLLMPGTPAHKGRIVKAVESGEMTEADLNRNVKAILDTYQKTLEFKGYQNSNQPDLDKSKEVALKAAEEGIVLLKNEGSALPLKPASKVALFGVASYETIAGGTGSGDVNKAYSVSLLEGLKNNNVVVNQELTTAYQAFIKSEKDKRPPKEWSFGPDEILPEKEWIKEELDSIAQLTDVGVFTINRTSGEFYDREQGHDFYLSKTEQKLVNQLSEAYRAQEKKFIVVLNIGGVIETASWKEKADAIVLMWQAGQEGGNAFANMLSGKVNPSGKLPMTFPVYYMDHYSSKNFPGEELVDNPYPSPFNPVAAEVVYEEDIYVGYRYFESFDVAVSYPFGFGLSYTDFEVSAVKAKLDKQGNIAVYCNVKNTGSVAGKEVVQVYVSAPNGKLEKPEIELRAFAKSNLLAPGEEQNLSFTIDPATYASFDSEVSKWVLEPGQYDIAVGTSSKDIAGKSDVNVAKTIEVLTTTKSLVPQKEFYQLRKEESLK
ncbi:beta-glucosidase family protein [Marinoscillum sp.]|uniref:beta-glucosidase n=1 Tax=Marinoscillum sp. TaxID=2024838 RepID=UPI003BAC47B1